MHAILDIQHAGRTKADLGARGDIDGDGVIETHEQEALLTPVYAQAAAQWLTDRGHAVSELRTGEYPARHEAAIRTARANPGARCGYVACHLNAGGGEYGLVLYDSRSTAGKLLAEHIAIPLRVLLGRVIVASTGDAASGYPRGISTIRGIYDGPANLSGVCFEPAFIDSPAHRKHLTPEGLAAIGRALAQGLAAWGG